MSRVTRLILVSTETINDYQLNSGDLLKPRVLDHRTGSFHVVAFHVGGVVHEFPSAPKDSFTVAYHTYLQAADHTGGPNVLCTPTSDPSATAPAVARATHGDGKDTGQQAQQTASSDTTVDPQGISRIEEAFSIALPRRRWHSLWH